MVHLRSGHLPVAVLTASERSRPSALSRRPEAEADAIFRFRLFQETHGAPFASFETGLAELLIRQQFQVQTVSYRVTYPNGRFDIVEVDAEPVGRTVTDTCGTFLTLVDIALLPDWRSRGIGTRLLRTFQDEARAAGVPLRLSVARTNERARRLYERLGLVEVEGHGANIALVWSP